jgi:hypothetical protein
MGEQIHPVEAKVLAQSFDVIDKAVAAVRGGVLRHVGLPRAPQIQHDQLPLCREASKVAQIGRSLHWPAGQADHGRAIAEYAVGELDAIVGGEGIHARQPAGIHRVSAIV